MQGRFARNVETEGGDAATDLETEASGISYEHCSYNHLSRETGGGDSMVFDDNRWWWWATPVAANRQQQQQQLGFDDEEQLWASLADMCSGT